MKLITIKAENTEQVSGAVRIEDVQLLAPIPHPLQDVICLGINYMARAEEASRFESKAFGGERPYPIYFSKRANEAVADGDMIPSYPELVDSLDYESELAVIIGKDAKNVSEGDVKDYIFGYTILNNVSARNILTRHKQWYFGKSMDGFTPMGPSILTADQVEFPLFLGLADMIKYTQTSHLNKCLCTLKIQ